MPIEDKLSQEQRIRLESVAQANMAFAGTGIASRGDGRGLIGLAKKIENFIYDGEVNQDATG